MIRATTIGYGSTAVVSRLLGVPPRRVRKMVARGELERVPSELGIPLYPLWPVIKLAVLRALPGSAAEIAEHTGVPEASIRRVLASLSEVGMTSSNGSEARRTRAVSLWTLTPRGVRHLSHFGLRQVVSDPQGGQGPQKAGER